MTTTFAETAAQTIPAEFVGGDEIQPIIVAIPMYHWVSAAFFANFTSLAKPEPMPVLCSKGVYVAQAMRHLVMSALRHPFPWKRFVVVEADMILPHDALLRHALHTDPVVGCLYFQHSPPFEANVMLMHPELQREANILPEGVRHMLTNPALYKVSTVSLGCTSIAREVLEDWPKDVPMFRTDYETESADNEWTQGEVSHDVYFCRQLRAQGYDVYMDSSIVCEHLTETLVGPSQFMQCHFPETTASRVLLPMQPNRADRRRKSKTVELAR